jgi:hypothetical protein
MCPPIFQQKLQWPSENKTNEPSVVPGTLLVSSFFQNANHFVGNRPKPQEKCRLYFVKMVLTSPISEEQNTRGRQLYPPEATTQSFGIVILDLLPKV